jgi:hypothetical protein
MDFQRNSANIAKEKIPSFIMRRGKIEGILLPFFTECDDFIEEYMEAYEIHKNREALTKSLEKSEASGMVSTSL